MRTKSLVLIIIALGCGLVARLASAKFLIKSRPRGRRNRAGPDGGGRHRHRNQARCAERQDRAVAQGKDSRRRHPQPGRGAESVHPRSHVCCEPILNAKLMANKDEPARFPKVTGRFPSRSIWIRLSADSTRRPGRRDGFPAGRGQTFLEWAPIPFWRMARVYAVNSQTDRDTDSKGHEVAARPCPLLVKPKQAERLTLATRWARSAWRYAARAMILRTTKNWSASCPRSSAMARSSPWEKVEATKTAPPVMPTVVQRSWLKWLR